MSIFEAINENRSVWDVKDQIDKIILDITTEKNECNETPFIWACTQKNLAWVDFLLSLGANPNDVNTSKQNALQLLTAADTPLMSLSALIEVGVDINHQDKDGQSPLFYALKYGRQDLTHLLLSEGANPDLIDKDGNSPLLLAALSGNSQNVEFLIESGAKVDASNLRKQSALHMATLSGSDEVVKLLVDAGISMNSKDISGRTALHYAAVQVNSSIIETLVDGGIDIDASDREGANALMIASRQGLATQVEALIRVGANPKAVDQKNETTVVKALQQEPIDVFHILAAETTDVVPSQKIKGVTEDLSFMNEAIRVCGSGVAEKIKENILVKSLVHSSTKQYAHVAEVLLDAGAPFDFKNDLKDHPELIERVKKNEALLKTVMDHEKKVASGQRNVARTQTSVSAPPKKEKATETQDPHSLPDPKGLSPNSRDAKGIPYLIVFSILGRHDVVEQLIKQGHDCKVRDKSGKTALMVASHAGHVDTVKVLLKYDRNVNFKTARGDNALLIAILENRVEIAALLLKAGANPDTRYKGAFILHFVAEGGKTELAKMMIQAGANPRVKDIKGRTPAQYAKAKGFTELEGILGGPKESA